MGKVKNTIEYLYHGEKYTFCTATFKNAIGKYKREQRKKCTNLIVFELIGQKVGFSSDTVMNWYKGKNGPNSIELVEDVADFFADDISLYLKKTEGGNKKMNCSSEQLEMVRKIYAMFAQYIELYGKYYGYADGYVNDPVLCDEGCDIINFPEEERSLHRELRALVKGSRFVFDKTMVDKLMKLLYVIEPDPMSCDITGFYDEYPEEASLPFPAYYVAERKVSDFYSRLDEICEQFFA